ncbi:nucleotide sugar dehydrogenase [Candidatus Cryosericum terrychapinii]|uniref:Nucleotide sugar dehydrogenase n=2 Tax=Candidatus Cryosericum terrychapinii TaxID=2290919 RepID=A0A398D404_9BACT|nr:nucleotide sugar dehydrogenase [Candidatus Cryosericum terrychapinii]
MEEKMERKLAMVGLGYVGLPLALTYALDGFQVSGVDIDPRRIESIKTSSLGMHEDFDGIPVNDVLRTCLANGSLNVTSKFDELPKDVATFIITVGIPIDHAWSLDMGMLTGACTELGKLLKRGDLVICRSTVPVGTTRGLVLSTLERTSGLVAGTDFDLAYSSERIAEGHAYDEFRNMPLVVGGINGRSLDRAIQVLGAVNREPVFKASSIELVEAAKMFENAQRDVNIAVADQLARFANHFDIPTWELVEACNTHSRVKILMPGIGVGGHCIPYASPYLFGSLSSQDECDDLLPTFISARQANAAQPGYIAGRMSRRMGGLAGKHVLFVGIAMKDYSDDVTGSPAVDLATALAKAGAEVRVLDSVAEVPREFGRETDIDAGSLWANALVLPIRQGNVDYERVKKLVVVAAGRLILCDFRGVFEHDADVLQQPWYVRL